VGAVDRLRAARPDEEAEGPYGGDDARVLAAVDPANPYGALLPWPPAGAREGLRPRRVPGAWVIMVDGMPIVYAGPRGRQLLTFRATSSPERGALEAAFHALAYLPRAGRKGILVVERVDDVPVRESPHYALLRAAGFESDYRGLAAPAAGR
jgi:ATP-dependent Lhr-like helicase